MIKKITAARAAAVGVAALTLLGVTTAPAASAATVVAATQTFVGYGYLPSDAHAAAVAQMTSYSASCREVGTVYSPAGSEHYWKATLTAEC